MDFPADSSNSILFKFKKKKKNNGTNRKDAEIMIPLKYLMKCH